MISQLSSVQIDLNFTDQFIYFQGYHNINGKNSALWDEIWQKYTGTTYVTQF